jgi:DNA-binding CsgD family transcriptional regulator
MPKKIDDEWLPDSRGRYRRKVGWWINEAGTRKQYPFSFGTDKDQAKARLARARELWSQVVKIHSDPPTSVDFPPPPPGCENSQAEPAWDSESLWIAKQLAAGKVQIPVGSVPEIDDYVYAQKIQELAKKYPFVSFVADDRERYDAGSSFLDTAVNHQLSELERRYPEALQRHTSVLLELTGTLHAALDVYIDHVRKHDLDPTPDGPTLSSFGSHKIANTTMLKRHQKDRPLSALDLDGCQELLDYWRMRPLTTDKRITPSRPMAKKTCENHVAEWMRLFRWLHKSKDFTWRKPEDFEELTTNVKDIQEERTSIEAYTKQSFYLPSELILINKHATPLERLLFLLGVNCGLKGAEQGTLLLDHIFLDRPHPNARYHLEVSKFKCRPDERFIIYSRNKSKVYGEFLLWPQTVEVIEWAIQRRNRIVKEKGLEYRNLLVTEQGTLFRRLTGGGKNQSQIFGNKWDALIRRVQKNEAGFPHFPFSSLRETASDLVRQVADGEVSATFLMHGQPVKQDDLLDIYTKRPFRKVFEALRQIQEDLKPMFDAAPDDVVEQPMQQYTPMNKRERIVELKKDGRNVTQIMQEVGVSRMTVLRTLQKLYFKIK